jgi:hypothetical protein
VRRQSFSGELNWQGSRILTFFFFYRCYSFVQVAAGKQSRIGESLSFSPLETESYDDWQHGCRGARIPRLTFVLRFPTTRQGHEEFSVGDGQCGAVHKNESSQFQSARQ